MYDFCIIGAGITGITCASVLARDLDKRVIIIEKRDHIGGNCYDCYNKEGIIIHKYGPHIFHTSYKKIWDYLSRFTDWIPYIHRVMAYIDGKLVPLPVNITTIEKLLGRSFDEKEMRNFIKKEKVKLRPKNAEEMVISRMGHFLYEKIFKNYTLKQWGVDAKKLSAEITARIPIRFNFDDRYFSDPYQGIPIDGYTKMFERMLSHKNIELVLKIDYKQIIDDIKFKKMIYTGPIDYFFDYQFGYLPYRSIRFVFKTFDKEWFQPVAVVNYPDEYNFTRITEFKHLTRQPHPKTTVCYEYPKEYSPDKDEPYYPLLVEEAERVYRKYKRLANRLKNVVFIGRLANFRYLNMDGCIKMVFDLFD